MRNKNYIILACFLLFSLSSFLITCSKNPVEPVHEKTVTISPDGGEYSFPDGILLKVPAEAVNENTDVMIKRISNDQLASIYNNRGIPVADLLLCIEGTPDGTEFIKLIQLCISIKLDRGDIPFLQEVDLSNGEYSTSETEIICKPDKDSLIISVKHFSYFFVEILSEIRQFFGGCGEHPAVVAILK